MGNVYFMRCAGLIKIGFTQDVGERLAQLQTGNPEGIELVAVLTRVAPSVERMFHRHFAADRARGEWFNPSPKLRTVIAHVQGGARVDTPRALAYYEDLAPNVKMHENPHVDVRLSAKMMFKLGYPWARIRELLEKRGAEYCTACDSFQRKFKLGLQSKDPFGK